MLFSRPSHLLTSRSVVGYGVDGAGETHADGLMEVLSWEEQSEPAADLLPVDLGTPAPERLGDRTAPPPVSTPHQMHRPHLRTSTSQNH